jgi:hypothetical protein
MRKSVTALFTALGAHHTDVTVLIHESLEQDQHRLLPERILKDLLLEEHLIRGHDVRQTPGGDNVAVIYQSVTMFRS